MLRSVLIPAMLFLTVALPVRAEPSEEVDTLARALALDELIAIMRQEGLDYGDELQADLFPGRGGDRWDAAVARIYDGGRMAGTLRDTLGAELGDRDIGPLVEFFTSERGARIIALEISARRALLDPEVEEASIARLEEMQADSAPRLDLIEDFVEANNLVEANVAGALNSNYAFYTGLADGKAFDFELTEEQMLADVWSQEPEIRDETRAWLFSYLAMAYAPLSDEALEAYIELSETSQGKALNRALFAGFDEVFTRISRDLGLAAARFIAGQDI
ncbi:hypothetical protein SAMN05444722_0864 [Rhodovulum sp. ES.010]|uniref:DUF2059 domain-containing protein n=1 Tax=Rhodovulum sp. ES.010 TaxID=1882821 RepID=UPI00092A36B0|nr:DUF2059 domain-containing protein [Rhodovulum sp. ES.010]SIO21607.1 hypothetical protein SAMN05444722_0864 [Rhodovulum sp. ES.010]